MNLDKETIKSSIKDYTSFERISSDTPCPCDLFANGWGRQGYLSLLSFCSGVAFAPIVTQCAYDWALGRSGILGIQPKQKLRVGVIQAWNDDNEIASICHSIRTSYSSIATGDEIKEAEARIFDFSKCFWKVRTAEDFCSRLQQVLHFKSVDVVVVYPLQMYLDFDLLRHHSEVQSFVWRKLSDVFDLHNVMMLACLKHDASTFSNYGGSGLINCSRAIVEIRKNEEERLSLIGMKRGRRLGWKDADGNETNERVITYFKSLGIYKVAEEAK